MSTPIESRKSRKSAVDDDKPEKATWVYKDLYTQVENIANSERYHVKRIVNALLESSLLTISHLQKTYPEIRYHFDLDASKHVELIEGDSIIRVEAKDGRLYCSKDKSAGCKHIQYAMLHPIAVRVLKSVLR